MKISLPVCFLILIVNFYGVTAQSTLAILINSSSVENNNEFLSYRLPNETYPEHYDIQITTNVHTGDRAFQGEAIIDIVVAKSTDSIFLHAVELTMSKATGKSSTGESEELSMGYDPEREFLGLTRKSYTNFTAGSKWKLSITYSGELSHNNRGFYMSSYVDDFGNDHYLALTHFESTSARQAFPCYDEPSKRANFTLTINHSPNYKAISNMPVNEALSSSSKTVFLTTAPAPTYILGFVVCDLDYTEGILNGLRQRVYSRSNAKHEQNFGLVSAMLFTKYFSEYYGIDFMLPKLDHIAVPDFSAEGMENWGLAIYPERNLLYNSRYSTVARQINVAKNTAHEIAHQWIGDYVTIEWWSSLWLKESLAFLFSYKAMDNVYPEWNVWQDFHAVEYQSALISDSSNTPRPLNFYVEQPSKIRSLYDEISYYKSSSVLLMWNNALSEKVFQKAIQNFLKNNQYSTVAEAQLFSEIQNAADEENYELPATINEMMSTWTSQGGYPILSVTRNYNDGTFIVKQEPFYDDAHFKDDKKWYVPINYAVASNPDFRDTKASHYLRNVSEMKISAGIAKADWLVFNKQSTGFYRIKYDEENYNLIIKSLLKRPSRIHSRNRAQLMHDAYYLSISNRLDHSILLKMLTYLKQETQFAPWSTASLIFNTYYRYLKNEDDFKLFFAKQFRPIFQKLGVDETPDDQHYDKLTRDTIIGLACAVGVEECLIETNNKLKNLIKQNITIEPLLEMTIYCNGLRKSEDEEFDFFYQKLMDSTDANLRYQFIYYLGCTRNKNHIKKFISSSVDMSNKLQIYERYSLLGPVYSRSEEGLLACIKFLNENLDAYSSLKNNIGDSDPLEDDIRGMARYVLSINAKKRLLALVDKVKSRDRITASLEMDVKKTIANNCQWLQDHGQAIMLWISQYINKSSNQNLLKSSK